MVTGMLKTQLKSRVIQNSHLIFLLFTEENQFVGHELFSVNLCWIYKLHLVLYMPMDSKKTGLMIFLGTKMRLSNLKSLDNPFALSFKNMHSTFLYSLGSSPYHHDISEMLESDLALTLPVTLRHSLYGPKDHRDWVLIPESLTVLIHCLYLLCLPATTKPWETLLMKTETKKALIHLSLIHGCCHWATCPVQQQCHTWFSFNLLLLQVQF